MAKHDRQSLMIWHQREKESRLGHSFMPIKSSWMETRRSGIFLPLLSSLYTGCTKFDQCYGAKFPANFLDLSFLKSFFKTDLYADIFL